MSRTSLLQVQVDPKDLFWISVITITAFVIVICTIVIALRKNERILAAFIRQDFTILRVITVIAVIWATTGLVIVGRFNEGVSAIFGAIIGYVFGSIRGGGERDSDSATRKPAK